MPFARSVGSKSADGKQETDETLFRPGLTIRQHAAALARQCQRRAYDGRLPTTE